MASTVEMISEKRQIGNYKLGHRRRERRGSEEVEEKRYTDERKSFKNNG